MMLLSAPLLPQEIFNGCGPEGTAKQAKIKTLNRLKNRYAIPETSAINRAITLQELLTPGDDIKRWKDSDAAEITGYVYDIKPGGVESCNCGAKDLLLRDTHIELTTDPMSGAAAQRFVAEMTPRMRAIAAKAGNDWSTKGLRKAFLGRWVKVRGWMLLDVEHTDEAENTRPGRARNWRGTAWEIHPVTSIEITDRPKK